MYITIIYDKEYKMIKYIGKTNRIQWNKDFVIELWNVYNERGWTLRQMGYYTKRHFSQIERVFKKYGLKTRNLNEACALRHSKHNFDYLTDAERGYIAGIIDGEGCITKDHRLQITNTNIEMLNWIKKTLQYGSVNKRKSYKSCHTQAYYYALSYLPFKKLLEIIKPLLLITTF